MKICIYDYCDKEAKYNIKDEKIKLYCKEHKLENMINIRNYLCIRDGCKKIPIFNYENQKKGLYCSKHKLENMIDIIHICCINDNCKKKATYNYENQKKGLYCKKHKLENMFNVVSQMCINDGCNKIAIYNVEFQKRPLYCKKHKLENMINVISKLCINDVCNKIAIFNYENQKNAIYCGEHKLENMVDVKNPKCVHNNCVIQPNYNYFGKKIGLYCKEHKLDNMINIFSKKCKSDWCLTLASIKYDGYCLFCFIHLFPDKKISRNYKTKEKEVANFIKKSFPDLMFISDKSIENGCSKRRPDLLLDLGYQIIIIEIDENQHTDYDCSCENKRMMILSQDVGHRPIIFIRFNPDNYYNNNEYIQSCWKLNNNGLCVVDDSKKTEWNQRLNRLYDEVNYWLINKTEKMVEIIQLFYDM
jgi:hypothetical protein